MLDNSQWLLCPKRRLLGERVICLADSVLLPVG